MSSASLPDVPDKEYRAILTEREREILSGEDEVSESYYYRVVTRVRDKIERVEQDLEVLDEHHDTLGDELREVVCETIYYCPRCGEAFPRPSEAHQHALHRSYQDEEHSGYDDSEVPNWWDLFPDEDESDA